MPNFTLRPDQLEDLSKFITNPRFINCNDPGTGKTPVVCVLQEYYWTEEKSRTFWPQPLSLVKKNYNELLKFTNFTPDDVAIYDGSEAKRNLILKKEPKVILLGYNRFAKEWANIKSVLPDFKSVVVDEMHLGYKGDKSIRTQALYKCMKTCKHFVPMSGTLIDGRLDSVYPTFHVVEPRYYWDHNAFIMQHALTDDYGRVMGWSNHEKIGHILMKHGVRRSFESIFGKEKPVIQVQECEMHPKQRDAYEELEAHALVELEDRFLEAQTPALMALRCRQIMQHPSSFGLMPEGSLTGKEEAILIHAEDHQRKKTPFVVFAVFQPEQERIANLLTELGLKIGLINGNISHEKRAEIDEKFRAGLLDGIVGSPETASVGFNWGHCGHFIYSSIDYRDTNFEQSYKRGIRGKRDFPLWVTVLQYADNPVEDRIIQVVENKSLDRHRVDNSYERIIIRS